MRCISITGVRMITGIRMIIHSLSGTQLTRSHYQQLLNAPYSVNVSQGLGMHALINLEESQELYQCPTTSATLSDKLLKTANIDSDLGTNNCVRAHFGLF